MTTAPYQNLTPEQILGAGFGFDSRCFLWRSLSWLDYAKHSTSFTALQYAALELRRGIEQLWFELIVTSVGGELDVKQYTLCKGDSTKMYKVLDRLSPDHTKLVRFTSIIGSLDCNQPPVAEWDKPRLKRLHGEISQYLHFFGIPRETTHRSEWFIEALTVIESGADYLWLHLTSSLIGQFNVESMPPEVRDTWEDFRSGQIDEDSARTRLLLAQPVLRERKGTPLK